MPDRRAALALALGRGLAGLVALGGLGGLSACGFELRRAPELRFSTVYLNGFQPRSALREELRVNIDASRSTQVVEAPAQAQVIFDVLDEAREKSVVASTAAGQVRELQLRNRLRFRLRTLAGKDLIVPTEIVLTRDLSYSESAALAKEHEEGLLYRAMQSDIVAQVMRRLAAVPAP